VSYVPSGIMRFLRRLPPTVNQLVAEVCYPGGHPDKPEGGWLRAGIVDVSVPLVVVERGPARPLNPRAQAAAQGLSEEDGAATPQLDEARGQQLEEGTIDWGAVGARLVEIGRNAYPDLDRIRIRAFHRPEGAKPYQIDMRTVETEPAEESVTTWAPAEPDPFRGSVREFQAQMIDHNDVMMGHVERLIDGQVHMAHAMADTIRASGESDAALVAAEAARTKRSMEDRVMDAVEAALPAVLSRFGLVQPIAIDGAPAIPGRECPAQLSDKRDRLLTLLDELSAEEGVRVMQDPDILKRIIAIEAASKTPA